MKLCTDCVHSRRHWLSDSSTNFDKCAAITWVVDGSPKHCCAVLREAGQGCGPEGKMFEPKPPKVSLLAKLIAKLRK